MSRQRGASKGMAIFGVVSCLALAAGWSFVAMRRDGEGLSVVFVVCHVALAGGWLWRYRQAVEATSIEGKEGRA